MKKNLCFKCDEPYIFGHKCKNKRMMIEYADEDELAEEGEEILLEHREGNKEKERGSLLLLWKAAPHLELLGFWANLMRNLTSSC